MINIIILNHGDHTFYRLLYVQRTAHSTDYEVANPLPSPGFFLLTDRVSRNSPLPFQLQHPYNLSRPLFPVRPSSQFLLKRDIFLTLSLLLDILAHLKGYMIWKSVPFDIKKYVFCLTFQHYLGYPDILPSWGGPFFYIKGYFGNFLFTISTIRAILATTASQLRPSS